MDLIDERGNKKGNVARIRLRRPSWMARCLFHSHSQHGIASELRCVNERVTHHCNSFLSVQLSAFAMYLVQVYRFPACNFDFDEDFPPVFFKCLFLVFSSLDAFLAVFKAFKKIWFICHNFLRVWALKKGTSPKNAFRVCVCVCFGGRCFQRSFTFSYLCVCVVICK